MYSSGHSTSDASVLSRNEDGQQVKKLFCLRGLTFFIEVGGIHVFFCTQIWVLANLGTKEHVDTPDFNNKMYPPRQNILFTC